MDGVNDYGGDFDWDHLDEVLARIRAELRAAKQRREGPMPAPKDKTEKTYGEHVVEYRDPRELVPDPNNARTHPADQIASLKAGIRRYGFTAPILLRPSGMIGAGHGRQVAAVEMINAGEAIKRSPDGVMVPTITLEGLSDAEWRGLVLADNKIALGSGWDPDILRRELGELKGLGFDLNLTGFGADEVKAVFAAPTVNRDPERTPEPPKVPVAKEGDLWRLGDHYLLCGDSTRPDDVERVLDGYRPHLMVTDPPYGVEYDPSWRTKALPQKGALATGKVLNDHKADWREAWALFPGDVAYVWHAGMMADIVAGSLKACSFEIRAQIIWNKSALVIGRGHYHPKHEPCWYAVRKGGTGHGTQKPIDAMRRPIVNNSEAGDRVYEPFSGSGTTIMAAHLTGRICHAIELNPEYVDVGVTRWEGYTGDEAVLVETGQTFAEVKAERLGQG